MRTLVMGDIHGNWKALCQCLDRSGFDRSRDTLIQLGDVVDGYDQVRECVEELLTIEHLIAIRGNHDAWFLDYICYGQHPDRWRQGGYNTARSYLRPLDKEHLVMRDGNGYRTALNPGDIPETHKRFFNRQLLYYLDDNNRCFVHGGFDRRMPFAGQPPDIYLWDRSLWEEALSFQAAARGEGPCGRFRCVTSFADIFIGHTETLCWHTDQPMKGGPVHNLDTGAGSRGRLTIMDLATGTYWQSDPAPTLYSDGYHL
jgi:serine/threonine protein phosphatase 1